MATPTKYTIIVENNSPYAQEFFFFQKPAQYVGGKKIYSNSIGHGGLPAKGGSNTQINFQVEIQYYAGLQKQLSPPVVGQAQIVKISIQPMDLANKAGNNGDITNVVMKDDSLYLTSPVSTSGLAGGSFRIATPQFNPYNNAINVGLGAINGKGEDLLSNFIIGEPNKNIDVDPIVIFYVQTGSYKSGTVVDFDTVSKVAAKCDASDGKNTFKVVYTENGKFEVS